MSKDHAGPARRTAVIASHPIEQQGPFFKVLAAEPGIDLMVFYLWKFGVDKPTFDPEFGKAIQWDIPLLDGYKHKFLVNIWPKPTSAHFFGETNPGVVPALWRGRYDALVVYGWSSASAWLAYFTAFLRGTPVYIRGENPLNQEMLKGAWRRGLKKIVLGWLFRRATGFFCIGAENRKFYEYYGVPARKLHFVPYAVDNARFMAEAERLLPQKAALRKEFGIGAEAIVILSLGKLIEKKRPMDLLHAYERITEPHKALVFVGDGPLRPQLERYVAEHGLRGVHFIGFRNQTEIGKFYALADVFAFPSGPGDTWGFVLNEAMCFNLPLVVSDIVGSVPDLVRQGRNGYIFSAGDVEALAKALTELVRDPARRTAFGKESREIVRGYSYEEGVEGMMGVMNQPTCYSEEDLESITRLVNENRIRKIYITGAMGTHKSSFCKKFVKRVSDCKHVEIDEERKSHPEESRSEALSRVITENKNNTYILDHYGLLDSDYLPDKKNPNTLNIWKKEADILVLLNPTGEENYKSGFDGLDGEIIYSNPATGTYVKHTNKKSELSK